jgi:hypothetical protein
MLHTLLLIFIVLCIVGLILWGVTQIPGLPPVVKTVVYVVVGVVVLIWFYSLVSGMVPGFK